MNGFFDSEKMKKIEEKDANHEKLVYKIKRQTFRQRDHPMADSQARDENSESITKDEA